ncbi:MAG TPA: hypothetical protein VIK33_12990 [Anaerolineae bacterium]
MDYPAQVKMLVKSLSRPTPAALSCFVLMALLRSHQVEWEADELRRCTGFNLEAIAEARSVLIGYGLACARPGGRRLRLTDAAVAQLQLFEVSQIGKPDPSAPVVVVDPLLTEITLLQEDQQQQQTVRSGNPIRRDDMREVLNALAAAAIGEPTRSQLAADAWITADRITRTAAVAKKTGGRTGVIVTNLRAHVEPPESEASQGDVGYQWQRYLDRMRDMEEVND